MILISKEFKVFVRILILSRSQKVNSTRNWKNIVFLLHLLQSFLFTEYKKCMSYLIKNSYIYQNSNYPLAGIMVAGMAGTFAHFGTIIE